VSSHGRKPPEGTPREVPRRVPRTKSAARIPSSKRPGEREGHRAKSEAEAPAQAFAKPSREAWAALGPYARTRLTVHALGKSLALDVPGDVFSTQRIDEGTQLLLSHLPASEPQRFLDLGCGYGALGLPVAARHPACRSLLVDRDLLAVVASAHNARALGLANVEARPSLGFRDLPDASERFDWLLCNVPARIGTAAIGHFLEAGRALLSPAGELRVVVIRDLVEPVREAARARGLSEALREIVHGPRHSVFAIEAGSGARSRAALPGADERESVYARDQSFLPLPGGPRAPGLQLARPHDASEDPRHAEALSLFFSAFPRSAPARVFAFRCGFGGAAIAALALWEDARVVAQERDLLDAAFLLRNARALALDSRLDARTTLFPGQAAGDETFDLVLGELSSSAGELVAARELKEARLALAPRGQALVLAPQKMNEAIARANAGYTLLLEHGPFAVWRASAAAR